jgi:hypothetical protein
MTLKIRGKLAEELYAFRNGRVTIDLIFGTRQLIGRNWEYGKESVMIFIDHKKVFNSEKRRNLEKLQISTYLLRKAKNTHKKTINCVMTNKGQPS